MVHTFLMKNSTSMLYQSTGKFILAVQVFFRTWNFSGTLKKKEVPLPAPPYKLDDQEHWIATARWDLSCSKQLKLLDLPPG